MTLDEAALLALFLETLLYGVFFTLYWLTLSALLRRGVIQRQLLIPVATLLLCIATAHLIIDFIRELKAFVHPSSANAYYSDIASPLELIKTALFITQPIVADCVIVWRCYVLYKKKLLVGILGCIVLLTNGTIGYYIVWCLSQASPQSTIYTTAPAFVTTFYILTVLISMTCTVLIAWRIYHTRHSQHGLAELLPLFIVIVESGALYATSVIALLAAFLTRSNGQYPAMDIATPLVGIVFCLVVLQVHFCVGGNITVQQHDTLRTQGVDAQCSTVGPMTINAPCNTIDTRRKSESFLEDPC